MMMKTSKKTTALLMSSLMVWTGLLASTASASVISTERMVSEYSISDNRAELKAALDRDDVRDRLMDLGVSADDVSARIDALTPTELAMLQERMDQMPAGSGGAVSLLALIVLIFFITDVLGITDIFPFVNAAK
ncbi:MAG: hypothetical protein ACI9BO_000166 [Zhongshania sp.]|jgi:hypothetical protein